LRRYETIFISYADLPEEEINGFIERYSAIIKDRKGTVIKVEKWGKRKLAYEIKKQARGFYVLIDFAGNSAIVIELERNLKIGDKILKFMTVKTKDSISPEEIEKEMTPVVTEEKAAAPPLSEEATPPQALAEPEKEEPAVQEIREVSSPEPDRKEEE
jgi:small subunit ribosomal protein S6